MPRRPDWIGVAKRHGIWLIHTAEGWWWARRGVFADPPPYVDHSTEEGAAREYCIHHDLMLEVLQTLAPPKKETPDADPQRPSS